MRIQKLLLRSLESSIPICKNLPCQTWPDSFFSGGGSSDMEMYGVSETRNPDAYLIEGADSNTQLTNPNLEQIQVMYNEGAPEFVVDQNLYYPAATNYGYYCTGFESPREWEDHHRIFGVDGPDIQYTGAQNESMPYVYYTPSYGYAQSPYNPYNPYIPGAMIGGDGPFGGAQQYYTLPNYQNPVSSPAYIPLVVQPDTIPDSSVDSLFNNSASVSRPDGRGLKHKQTTASGAFTRNSSKPLSNQTSSLARVSEGPRANAGGKQAVKHGSVSGGGFLNFFSSPVHQGGSAGASIQPVDNNSSGNVVSHHNQLKVGPPSNSGFSDFGSGSNGQPIGKLRPKNYIGKAPSDVNGSSDALGEQNRGPRINRSKHQLTVKAYTAKAGDGNAQGNIIIHTDQYNREDFPVDYENAKFFVIKSYSEDDVHKSIKYNIWSSTPHGNKKLDSAYEDAKRIAAGNSGGCPIFLFFSVNASGQFCGVAEMVGPVDFNKDMDFWQQDKWSGSFSVKWHMIKDVPNANFRHIILENNENKPVTNSRDTQEIMYKKGLEMLKIFKNHNLKTSLLDDFMYYENRQKIMQEEKAKLLIRNLESPFLIQAIEPPRKSNFVLDVSRGKEEKISKLNDNSESIKQTSVPSTEQIVSNPDVTNRNSADENAEKTVVDKDDITSVLKIGSVTITPKPLETKLSSVGVANKEPVDVLTVGSMQVKVNGFAESSGFLKYRCAPPEFSRFPVQPSDQGEMTRDSNGNCSTDQDGKRPMVPKTEILDYELSTYTTFSTDFGDNIASSSGGNLRAFFIGMGFIPSLVDRVLEENGGDNVELLLETLFTYSALQNSNLESSNSLDVAPSATRGKSVATNFFAEGHSKQALQKSNSQSSDSVDALFDDEESPEISTVIQPKEERDEFNEVNDDKRASLLMMNFSMKEVEFAINRLGEDASLHELVNCIVAAQIAEKCKKEVNDTVSENLKSELNNEKLYGTMEKTLQLLEMGFSESEVSSAIERLGSEYPISELANCIFASQNGIDYVPEYKFPATSTPSHIQDAILGKPYGTIDMKIENFVQGEPSRSRDINLEETYRGKRLKEEYGEEIPGAISDMRYFDFMDDHIDKRLKQEYNDISSSSVDLDWVEEKVDTEVAGQSNIYKSKPPRVLNAVVAKPPYFFYGNISNISYDSWRQLSQFLYAVEPEFVNTQHFSALSRREGYIHNLPAENRFHIIPESPMTIQDAIPNINKWWPSWDMRRQLSCTNCETSGIQQLCDRFSRVLAGSGGVPRPEEQKNILNHCRALNLVWIGKYKLGPMQPEHLEVILGYPLNHTGHPDISLIERLKSLKHCFQTDALGYHLSVLKSMFPGGLTLLSIFSGIGGAEIALHRLGIKLKAVVSVETSETNRKILKSWWAKTNQIGDLVQIEDISRLTGSKLENLSERFGVFDVIICQNPPLSSSSSSKHPAGDNFTAADYSLFYEFVRVLQRVKNMRER
ncbi:hypothetical protein L6164_013730 [Bauhinia variegata]|uniref:Uncharacterized protein n=1 Tax=Bauhinia variegata TaxID=167791 RepID=A0ACB9NFV4_BAUVA|nr:hypothetical protein L6164_013730 [Bauhinia variegata]